MFEFMVKEIEKTSRFLYWLIRNVNLALFFILCFLESRVLELDVTNGLLHISYYRYT